MAGHKHAALMADYAKDAAETERPWERWESRINLPGHGSSWRGHAAALAWDDDREYRRKPRTLTIAGKTIEAPLVNAAHGSDAYACSAAGAVNHITCNINSEEHADALSNGRLFATPEAAKAAYDAITALLTGKDAA